MKKLLISIILLSVLFSSSAIAEEREKNGDMPYEYINLTFEDYEINDEFSGSLTLKAENKRDLSLTFKFYFPIDELWMFKECKYFYNMYEDILIILHEDYGVIYNDLNL